MDFHELQYLTTIARCENLTSAAKELFVSQPTLTKLVQRVEAEIGTPLFEHIGRKMKPTYAGQRYLAHAEKILAQKSALDAEMRDILREDSGTLTVGMPPFRCTYTLSEILPDFAKAYPNIEFTLVEADSAELDEKLTKGKVDLAFYMNFAENKNLRYQIICNDRPYAIFEKGHPLEEKAKADGYISLSDLQGQPIILQTSAQRLGQYVISMLNEHHITPKVVLRNTNLRASAALAANGYGIAFTYGEMVKYMHLPEGYNIFPVKEFTMKIDHVAAYRETTHLPGYAEYFIDLICRHQQKIDS